MKGGNSVYFKVPLFIRSFFQAKEKDEKYYIFQRSAILFFLPALGVKTSDTGPTSSSTGQLNCKSLSKKERETRGRPKGTGSATGNPLPTPVYLYFQLLFFK